MKGVRQFIIRVLVMPLLGLALCMADESMQMKQMKGLAIDLISEQSVISAGTTFTLGVRVKHEKGFHTYWKSPGIVGLATKINWKLPEGFSAGEIQWSYPELCSMAGHPCYGYERDVVLLVQIKAPQTIYSKNVKFTAGLSWMCCADDCFPGFKDLSIVLPVDEKSKLHKENSAVILEARKQLPKKLCPWDLVMLSKQDEGVIKFELRSKRGREMDAPDYFFSDDGQVSSDGKQEFIKQEDGSYLFEIRRSEFSPKSEPELSGVLKVGRQYFLMTGVY